MSSVDGIKAPSSNVISVVVPAGACIASCVIGGLILKKAISKWGSTDDMLPEKWVKVAELKDLLIYPVKGLPGISVKEAVLGSTGLKDVNNPLLRDRVFAVVNVTGKCLSLMKLPLLALGRAKIIGNKLCLSHVKDSSMNLTIDIPSGECTSKKVATIYEERIMGVDCGDEVATWLTKCTGTPDLRLLYHTEEETQRSSVKRNSRFHTYRESHTGAFQDETSYMLQTDESLAVVNAQLDKPVSHANFRPTIVVSGVAEPFAEDFWGYIKFGQKNSGPVLKASLPCRRCKTTVVDPETGTYRDDGEPLKTLYRLKRPVGDTKINELVTKCAVMGAHYGVFEGEGMTIRVGDPVYAALL